MKQNKYDDPQFFHEYSKMPRSLYGLEAAGEWSIFRTYMPDLVSKKVLDLGCGYGWHCQFAAEQGAASVIGIDLSEKMLQQAKELTTSANVYYQQIAIEDFEADAGSFDVIISSLALHYIEDIYTIFKKAAYFLSTHGELYYSVEHPVFTACTQQNWHYDLYGNPLHWPVDDYFNQGERKSSFLGSEVIKYHRTIETHINSLLRAGFSITTLIEPVPPLEMIEKMGWENELRRPMMLIIKAKKQ
ncbi:class I SAM-dependent methyltransferase [Acinetobacter sp. VNK23]|uniref:class I SAM-dependent methyltransferase n=1 Tax=Acinetobacter TaxID=469 RepID=UPI002578F19D|nr:class I SAM-dependent methyltransferase [Acinetobacter thutiue]MDM1020295.1 class I SAM-dependent methyltransferase [Acinetobacter thutiue]